jgi:hypothetical protein
MRNFRVHHRRIRRAPTQACAFFAAWAIGHCSFTATFAQPAAAPNAWDTFSDTWVATDALGRSLPTYEEVGPPRSDRTVGVFYFLWHGAHIQGGPYDIAKILQQDSGAMTNKFSPLWGPMHAPHHWGESIFGYYLTDDAGVLRKHAQMLADAGVDAILFDCSNQVTYKPYYMALLRVFDEVRRAGGRPPQVGFLCPFWDPAKVVAEVYRDLYEPGLYPELWFRWEGKPLILADPAKLGRTETIKHHNGAVRLEAGHTLGQSFTAEHPFESVGGCFPTWTHMDSAMTLILYRDGPKGARLLSQRFEKVFDNGWLALRSETPLPAGTYYLEMSEARGVVGWWTHTDDLLRRGQAHVDGAPVAGDRNLQVAYLDERSARIRQFFTFRRPQPDYFLGQTVPNEWSWLEVYPQHVFTNAAGQKEQMSVGVAQNAVGSRLGSMSEPNAKGRSFHRGVTDPRPGAGQLGLNVTEQWDRALKEDPRFLFITGWNEWIAGRFDEFSAIKRPVMFVDQFDQEHSRDIEPMKGGHGDAYYYQMVSNVRRYKGVRPLAAVTPKPIEIDGRFQDWREVQPEFRDAIGDPSQRQHLGWDAKVIYTNFTGRNDLVAAKVSWDTTSLYFYVRTRKSITAHTDPNWMLLFLDADANATNGWLGYDFVANRTGVASQGTTLERHVGSGYRWTAAGIVEYRAAGNELELALPLAALGLKKPPPSINFKWADNLQQTGDWSDFTLNGDAAPNDRFNYPARFE